METKRAYRFRCYPTPGQRAVLARTFGCVRFAYNYMLRVRTDAWDEWGERVGYRETSALLTGLKRKPEYAWLNEVSSVPVQQGLRHLQRAFANFFAGRGDHPVPHRRRGGQFAEYTASGFSWDGTSLRLARMEGPLRLRLSRTVPRRARVTTVTVSRDPAGRYFASLLCDDSVNPLPEASASVGVDLGLAHFAVLSGGEKVPAPNAFRKNERKLARLQRRLAKKEPGSHNRAKAQAKAARLAAKIADARRDFLHKLSTRLIRENQTVAVETLAVGNLAKNRHLAKSIHDAGWGEFVRQLEYKARWYGRTLVRVGRWYPSSKLCSACGYLCDALPLSVRSWTCPSCGTLLDRDVNAACNILAAGHAAIACGETGAKGPLDEAGTAGIAA